MAKYFVGSIFSRKKAEQTVLCKALSAEKFIEYFEACGEMVDEYEEVELVDLTSS